MKIGVRVGADDLILQWLQLDAEALVRRWICVFLLLRQSLRSRARVRECHAGFERSERADSAIAALKPAGVRIIPDGD